MPKLINNEHATRQFFKEVELTTTLRKDGTSSSDPTLTSRYLSWLAKKNEPKGPTQKVKLRSKKVSVLKASLRPALPAKEKKKPVPKTPRFLLTLEEKRARKRLYLRGLRFRINPPKPAVPLPPELIEKLFTKILEARRSGPRLNRGVENKSLIVLLSETYTLTNARIGKLIGVTETSVSQILIRLGMGKKAQKTGAAGNKVWHQTVLQYDPYLIAKPVKISEDSKRAIITPVDEFFMLELKKRGKTGTDIAKALDLSPVTVTDRLKAYGMGRNTFESHEAQIFSMLSEGLNQRAIEKELGFRPRSLSTFLIRRQERLNDQTPKSTEQKDFQEKVAIA